MPTPEKSSEKDPTPYSVVTFCKRCGIIKIMERDFGDELKSELEHLEYFYNFMYFNDALVDEEKWVLEKLIRTHRDVISFLGGKNDEVSADVL